MEVGVWVGAGISGSALLAWCWLTLFRGRFWATDQRLDIRRGEEKRCRPGVVAVVPARNEAAFIGETITSVLGQRYGGRLIVYLVDDQSCDGTADVAKGAALRLANGRQVQVVTAKERPGGWVGKVWALQQGIEAVSDEDHEYLWLTDADIVHSQDVLTSLVARAEGEGLDMVSVMAKLHVSTLWDRLLIPAFVFFFGKLYPFRWVNDHGRETAAAAGGCVLVRKARLVEDGGFETIRDAVIDDCALAKLVRGPEGRGRLWLGMSQEVRSIRPYEGLKGIWGHGGQDGVCSTGSFTGTSGRDCLWNGVALRRATGGGGGGDRVSCCRDMGHAFVGPVVLGCGGVGVEVCAVHTDVEVVRAGPMACTYFASGWGPVHTNDPGLGAEELDGEGRGVEG